MRNDQYPRRPQNILRNGTLIQEKRMTMQITVEDFDKVDVRIGTIVAVDINKKARKPAYKLTVDLGEELGIKTSSAQITDLYTPEDLLGRQAVFCVNLAPMHIGSVRSEVRILGSESQDGVVLLQPSMPVRNLEREPNTDESKSYVVRNGDRVF